MRLRKHKRAQGLVEFALILPVLLLIIVGIMEFGRIFIIYTSITNAVREGARLGVVVQNETEIRQVVDERIILVPAGDVIVTAVCDSGPGAINEYPLSPDNCYVGGRVKVRAEYTIQALTPIIQPFLGGGIAIAPRGIRTITSARTISSGAPAPTITPDGSFTNTPDANATGTASVLATGTAGANQTATVVALSATPTNTPDPLASPTPIILAPINIANTPEEGDTLEEGQGWVSGFAEPGQAVTLRIIQTGLVRTVTVSESGDFYFGGLPALTAGHTVLVQGYGEQDLAIVDSLPTPTPTLTPTSTPVFTENIISLSVDCTNGTSLSLTVTGTEWPTNASKINEARFMLYLEDNSEIVVGEINLGGSGGFSYPLVLSGIPEGRHHIQVLGAKNGNLVTGYESNLMAISRPCPATATPLPTATPLTESDLVVTGVELQDGTPYGTYEQINVTVGIGNIGERDVSTLHWVDLFANASGGFVTETISADYVALNALGAGSTISFTMYVADGFETTGIHTLQVMVDTWNQVEESDETNNLSEILSFDITVPNPSPTPTEIPLITPGPRGSIAGKTYLDGAYQSNVAVYVYDAVGRLWGSGRSDINGDYMIDDLPPGVYTLVGQLRLPPLQYLTSIGNVPVNSGLITGVDIDLIELP